MLILNTLCSYVNRADHLVVCAVQFNFGLPCSLWQNGDLAAICVCNLMPIPMVTQPDLPDRRFTYWWDIFHLEKKTMDSFGQETPWTKKEADSSVQVLLKTNGRFFNKDLQDSRHKTSAIQPSWEVNVTCNFSKNAAWWVAGHILILLLPLIYHHSIHHHLGWNDDGIIKSAWGCKG